MARPGVQESPIKLQTWRKGAGGTINELVLEQKKKLTLQIDSRNPSKKAVQFSVADLVDSDRDDSKNWHDPDPNGKEEGSTGWNEAVMDVEENYVSHDRPGLDGNWNRRRSQAITSCFLNRGAATRRAIVTTGPYSRR